MKTGLMTETKAKAQKLVSLGVTQSAMCRGAKLNDSTISKWLKNERNLSEATEKKVAAWIEEFKKQVAEL